ncbi:MAG: TolB family protein [Crocinitomicaceae bacterium]
MSLTNKVVAGCVSCLILVTSCYDRQTSFEEKTTVTINERERSVDYRALSVPEEGGMRFIRFTSEDEKVFGPSVRRRKGVLSWYTAPFIAVSPSGDKVAYIGSKDDKNNVYIKSLVGGKSTIQRTFRDKVLGVSFSKDGEKIAFVDVVDGNSDIFQINATQGAAVQQIAKSPSGETSPTYGYGEELFYAKSEYASTIEKYRYYIWSYNLKTGLNTQYSEGHTPCLSKNDEMVYITRNDKELGFGEIWSIDLKTGQEIRILDDSERGFSTPQISPDGKKLLCTGSTLISRNRVENLDVYIVNTDGTGLTQLTFHPGDDVSAVWGPNGDKIYFLSQRGNEKGAYGVWMIDYKN